ncbi:VOC family protein [Falsibacillus pallidus]|uniref:VOC family protein n=1 Tax=Falsibacillus pallidus TaxID=493781 RepID=UPI003D974C8F
MLFHYHFWTPHLEETEEFYVQAGFQVHQRIGRYNGEFQSFDPPLTWNDFRDKSVLFRIIELRKGSVNITFGYGKRPVFDHIGFLVSEEEKNGIIKRAGELNWSHRSNERRTFIETPYGFKIELQTNVEYVKGGNSAIERLDLSVNQPGAEESLSYLLNRHAGKMNISQTGNVQLNRAYISELDGLRKFDPNGLEIVSAK